MPSQPRRAVIRVAAVGDLHIGAVPPPPALRFDRLRYEADLLLLAGDLTRSGSPEQARVVAALVAGLAVPVMAVLGNHDHHDERVGEVTRILVDAGVRVLDGTATTVTVAGVRVGVAGVKGFGGGFPGARAHPYGEPEMKAFARHSAESAARLGRALAGLARPDCDLRIALTHYAPTVDTLAGERRELHPLLGSGLLGAAIDEAGRDAGGVALAAHGHAHRGRERGTTPGGVPVRNVAYPVIRAPYRVYPVAPSTGPTLGRLEM